MEFWRFALRAAIGRDMVTSQLDQMICMILTHHGLIWTLAGLSMECPATREYANSTTLIGRTQRTQKAVYQQDNTR